MCCLIILENVNSYPPARVHTCGTASIVGKFHVFELYKFNVIIWRYADMWCLRCY